MTNRVAPYFLVDGEPCGCPACRLARELERLEGGGGTEITPAPRSPLLLGFALLTLAAIGAVALARLGCR